MTDLGDPDFFWKATMQEGLLLELANPERSEKMKVELRTELMGIGFVRAFGGDPDQRAWEECQDPERMMRALAMVGQEAPIRAVTVGVERFLDETRTLLVEADPMDWPEARGRLSYFDQVLATSGSIKHVCDVGVQIRQPFEAARDPFEMSAAGRLARHIFLALPIAPHRFAGDLLPDVELVNRLVACQARFNAQERAWLAGLHAKVEGGSDLNPSQRARAETVLRSAGAWQVYSEV